MKLIPNPIPPPYCSGMDKGGYLEECCDYDRDITADYDWACIDDDFSVVDDDWAICDDGNDGLTPEEVAAYEQEKAFFDFFQHVLWNCYRYGLSRKTVELYQTTIPYVR